MIIRFGGRFSPWLLVVVTVIAVLIRATSKNPAGRTKAPRSPTVLHIKAPRQSVTEMNGTIQIDDNHTGEAAATVRRTVPGLPRVRQRSRQPGHPRTEGSPQ